MIKELSLSVLLLAAFGCSSRSYTENYQALTARTTTDTAMTVTAEEANLTSEDMKLVGECNEELIKFLEGGSVTDLTSGEIVDRINKIIPDKYKGYFNVALAYLNSKDVKIKEEVPAKTLRLTLNALYGIRNATTLWVDAPKTTEE